MLENKRFTFDRVIRLGITAIFLWGLIYLLGYLSDVLIPFAVAFLLAYLINPLVVLVRKKIRNRAAAVFASLLLVVFSTLAVAALVIPMVINEIGHMGRVLSDLVNNSDLAARAARSLPPDLWQGFKELIGQKEILDFFRTESFWRYVGTTAQKILPGVWGVIAGTTSVLMGLVGLTVIGLYLVFLLLDYQKIKEGWTELLPPAHRDQITSLVREFDAAMSRYFRAQAFIASLTGVLSAVGFVLIGLPLGLLLGLFIGLLNMVPYLQLIGIPPALILGFIHALETGGSIWVNLGLIGLVFLVVQAIQDFFLVPRIMGDVTGLSPAAIMLSLSVWGKLLGMLGLLIALPMTCLLLVYYRRFLAEGGSDYDARERA
ncbi:MAG: AI-2E family transporter [Pseudomonadota bacterium]